MKEYIQESFFIDPKTGEVLDLNNQYVNIQTHDQRIQAKQYFDSLKEKRDIDEAYKKYGNFIWKVYGLSEQLFPTLKPSNLTRLMFVATYVGYNGYLIAYDKMPLTKNQVNTLLNLSERECRNFWDEMSKNNIISFKNNRLYLDKNAFKRGEIPSKELARLAASDKFVTRLYINGIRELYRKATPKSHKTLSYIFQILPFVNRQYNIVCHNPLEKNLNHIKCMTLGEFCDVIGYDKTHASRLCNILFEPTFLVHKKQEVEQTAMRYVISKSLDKKAYTMFINPHVYYAGSNFKDVEILGQF